MTPPLRPELLRLAGQASPSETSTIPPSLAQSFAMWLRGNNITDLDAPDSHYDYRGAFLAGVNPAANGHYPDTFKQHGHPTFSQESQYSTGPGDGGTWNGETFTSPTRPDSLATMAQLRKMVLQRKSQP
jgi:hypothetical protein